MAIELVAAYDYPKEVRVLFTEYTTMPSVSANTISLIVLALVFALFGISDIKKKE